MSGTEKFPILLIGKSKSPRCFKGVKTLPVNYRNNKKAWMTSIIFWLKNLNQEMKAQKRKILMFVDNGTAHNNIPELSHIKLAYLSANTTITEAESLQEEDENLETDPEDWNLAISNDNNQQPTFQDFINVDDGLIVSELNESDIVHAFSSSLLENEEEGDEMSAEVNLVKISKREAVKALETLHSYFEMSSIGDQSIFITSKNI
ncbi:uncharacterized protein LOC130447879 [Diorhabda sublineata]|uniref:uncharacterized protein LOC130447879 n=1 Tax=Diorhabda sublineata TaxID=1163346 RepID=UPI0024E0E44F|nr:uncharacterized protein LOC130447879 [Diorhabda sublineata]